VGVATRDLFSGGGITELDEQHTRVEAPRHPLATQKFGHQEWKIMIPMEARAGFEVLIFISRPVVYVDWDPQSAGLDIFQLYGQ